MDALKHFLFGSPIPTHSQKDYRLNNIRALAAFSPDALSSIAYANQEIYLALVVAGSAGLGLSFPIGLAITCLLVLVALSYFQTIQGYPSGGGSYVVARENLGEIPGLAAGAALLVGYTLTAAVSLTSGVAAIASSFPFLWRFQTPLALFFLLIITLINLRGIQESGTAMAVPVYLFLVSYLLMLTYGFIHALIAGEFTQPASIPIPSAEELSTILILEAFSAGCTALTGIEAISNGVPIFKKPEVKNAGKTLLIMALLMAILFIGSIGLTQYLKVIPMEMETILSALAHRILGNGFGYLLIQISSTLILIVAANTSFAGFPRLAAILAKDNFMPRPLTQLGDRLVYNNGILTLASATGLLIVLFRGDSHALVPLFAIGVFLAFTLSQIGMVAHWWRTRGKSWGFKISINLIGALATGCATAIIGITKFNEGAWISILLIPLIMWTFMKIREHYQLTAQQLTISPTTIPAVRTSTAHEMRIVLPISDVHAGILEALNFAKQISNDIHAIYVEIDPDSGVEIKKKWKALGTNVPLTVIPSPYRSIISPLLEYLDQFDEKSADGQQAALVLLELIPAKRWHRLLHNQSVRLIKSSLLYRRRNLGFQRVIIDVPYHLDQ